MKAGYICALFTLCIICICFKPSAVISMYDTLCTCCIIKEQCDVKNMKKMKESQTQDPSSFFYPFNLLPVFYPDSKRNSVVKVSSSPPFSLTLSPSITQNANEDWAPDCSLHVSFISATRGEQEEHEIRCVSTPHAVLDSNLKPCAVPGRKLCVLCPHE